MKEHTDDKEFCQKEDKIHRFVYEPISGLYYDEKTGYYYNADYNLYYNGSDGCYYKLNDTTEQFELYSEANENLVKENLKKTEMNEIKCNNITNEQRDDLNDKEDGELSSDSDNDLNEGCEPKDAASFINEIRQAAESAQILNGFIYEPISGLFYDKKSGYYYDAEYGLYYDGNTGSYYKLNQSTDKLELYYEGQYQNKNIEKFDYSQKRKFSDDTKSNNIYVINESSDKFENDDDNDDNKNFGDKVNDIDNYKEHYQPSLRIIVQETNLLDLRVGMLFIITFEGGTLGREGGTHNVIIPDANVSKYHLKFTYNDTTNTYQCIDLGSRNGTLLNGKRMSSAKQESEPFNIEHGSIIQLSRTKLLCHIHDGYHTCNDCEPGCVMEKMISNIIQASSHKEQLKKLKKKYGLNVKSKQITSTNDNKYNDRAAIRRKTIGSTNEHEKTQTASSKTEIPSDNKGFKMLEKLGWKKGQALGKDETGIKTPINLDKTEGTKGFGYETNDVTLKNNISAKQNQKWKKAQERYKSLLESYN